ncbi:MAG: AraC family transcriptional regulator [Pseudomonadota bacterium]|nr:AraC family transcriptional regulator [Pseudomonadota bacterium]
MTAHLSVRSYTFPADSHAHHFHQLVFPLHSRLDIKLEDFEGRLFPGSCCLYKAGQVHYFAPEPGMRYLVMDADFLPLNLLDIKQAIIRLPHSIMSFCYFAEQQLLSKHSPTLEVEMAQWLLRLLELHQLESAKDVRIEKAITVMSQDLSQSLTLEQLASIACLSLSQFKTLFKKETNQTPGQYLASLRMTRAYAMLSNTDIPINIIAESVGYKDSSAFSQRFHQRFQCLPSQIRKSQ